MNNDQVKGRMEEVAGKTKKVVGEVFRDGTLKQKGRLEEAAGKVRSTYGDAKEEWKKGDEDKKNEMKVQDEIEENEKDKSE
jgi:uncharacterized protein YjbJ (UPF0337 family)